MKGEENIQEGRTYKSLVENSGILCKGNKVEIYQFILANKEAFGLRWLLEKCSVYPHAFYNFLKQRKAKHRLEKNTHTRPNRRNLPQENLRPFSSEQEPSGLPDG